MGCCDGRYPSYRSTQEDRPREVAGRGRAGDQSTAEGEGWGALAWLGLPLVACYGAKLLLVLGATGAVAGLAALAAVVAGGWIWLARQRRAGASPAGERA